VPRVTIQQFRAALAGRTDQGLLVRPYRRLARRPELAAGNLRGDWGPWAGSAAAAA
jgi:hypothetical protein